MQYRPDIDGLRTLAVVPVVLYHAGFAGFSGGFVGVDIFFVISGFLITTIIHRELTEGRFSIVQFYERRARRILPALFVVMAASLVAGWFLLAPADYEHMGESVLSALLFVSNIWFWQNSGGYFDGSTDYLPMLHTWSLAVEEQFYIFFPLLLMLLHRVSRRLVLPTILALILGSLVLSNWATPRMPSASFYLLPTRIWELGLGALLALGVAPAQLARPLREGLAAAGLLAVLAPVFLYDSGIPFPGLAALLPVTGAALLIWTGGTGPTLAARLLSLRPMVFIGLISYSLYLWHWPIMAFVRNRFFSPDLEPGWQVATVLASVGAAWLSWRYIERPFRVPAHRGGVQRPGIFFASGAGMAVLGAGALSLILTEGARQRFTPQQQSLLASTDFDPEVRACSGRGDPRALCVFGTRNSRAPGKWVLWGDSHSESLLPAVDLAARRNGKALIFAGLSACAPIPGIERQGDPVTQRKRCLRQNHRIEQFLLESEDVDTVILHARWPLYVEGSRFGQTRGERIVLASADTATADDNPRLIATNLGALVSRLSAAGLNVVIVGSVPEIPWDVKHALTRHILYSAPAPDAIPRAIVEARQSRTEALLARTASRHGAAFLPITPALCPETCPTHDQMTAFYSDSHHLTPAGAIALIAPLLSRFPFGKTY